MRQRLEVESSWFVDWLIAIAIVAAGCSPAFAESYATVTGASYSGGIGAVGGESQSGGVLGGEHTNEVVRKPVMSDSISGGPSSATESGSVFSEQPFRNTGYSNMVQFYSGDNRGDSGRGSGGNSVPSGQSQAMVANHAKPVAAREPQMLITSYKWGAAAHSDHTLAAKPHHAM